MSRSKWDDKLGIKRAGPAWEVLAKGLAKLREFFERHGVTPKGRQLVERICCSDPVKRVKAGRFGSVVRFASRKMRRVIQAHSLAELLFAYQCEYSDDVALYLCQPCTETVVVRDVNGRRQPRRYTPDYLVLDERGFAFVECKTLEELQSDAQEPYPRYARDGARWRFPAAESAFAKYGVAHRVVIPEEVNTVWVRNVRFVSNHVGAPEPQGGGAAVAEAVVRAERSMVLGELLERDDVVEPDVHWLLANRRLFCDFEHERLYDCTNVWVHESEAAMLAHRHLRDSMDRARSAGWPFHHAVRPVVLEPGESVVFDETRCTVRANGGGVVALEIAPEDDVESMRRDDGAPRTVEMAYADVKTLLRSARLRAAGSAYEEAASRERAAMFLRASPAQLLQASKRWQALVEFERHGTPPQGHKERTVREHRRWVLEAEKRWGAGFLGLLRVGASRVGEERIPKEQAAILKKHVRKFRKPRETKQGDDASRARAARRVSKAYAAFRDEVTKCQLPEGEAIVCERTFRRWVKCGSRARAESARRGDRAGYQLRGPRLGRGPSLPRNGDRIWEVAHLDHTELDVMLVSTRTGTLVGRPWLSLLVDAFSRHVLGFHLSFRSPSRDAVFATLYDVVWRSRRVPELIVVDQGAEFLSVDLDVALAYLLASKRERPAGQARYGALVERLFGTVNTRVVHEAPGSTEPVALGRMLSASHRPERTAQWTLARLWHVLDDFFFNEHPTLVHGSFGDTPRGVWQRSEARCGAHVARYVACDDALRAVLSQSVDGDTRCVENGGQVVVKYMHYAHKALEDDRYVGENLPVRVSPSDLTCAWVYVPHRHEWVPATLIDGDADLYGRSWRDCNHQVEELIAQRVIGASSASRNANSERMGEAYARYEALDAQSGDDAAAHSGTAGPAPANPAGPETLRDAASSDDGADDEARSCAQSPSPSARCPGGAANGAEAGDMPAAAHVVRGSRRDPLFNPTLVRKFNVG